ncbi:DUF4091 domain-containing protein [bacterium]|nr:DUF4091 domain-containing protein [bacterium]
MSLLAVAFAMLAVTVCLAEVPAQFRTWGSAGGEIPPPPEGWHEAAVTAPATGLSPSPEDQSRGWVAFVRDPLQLLEPTTLPWPEECGRELRTVTTRGEYEPLSVGVLALSNLSDLRVTAGELRCGEAIIPADCLDVRFVRAVRVPVAGAPRTYRQVPWLLEKRPNLSLQEGQVGQVWVTVWVPADAVAGEYRGALHLSASGRSAADLPIRLRVLPLRLPPASVSMAMYAQLSEDDALLRRELTDLREHGIESGGMDLSVVIKSRDQVFGEDDLAATRQRCRQVIAAYREVFGKPRFPVAFEAGHQIAYYWDTKKNWFSFWEHSPKIDDDLERAIDVVVEEASAAGWNQLQAYLLDEAGAHNLLDEAVHYYRLAKQHRPQLQTWSDLGGGIAMGHDEIGKLSPWVDFLSTNRFTPEIARQLLARQKPYGIYNGCGDLPAGARLFFGFYGWKTGATSISQWAYNFNRDNLFRGGGMRGSDDGYVYYGPDGPVPSILWEAVREGVKDYRAADYLERLIQAAKVSGATAAADKAQRVLDGVLGQIGWDVQPMTSGDRAAPPDPSSLRKWRVALLQEAEALQAVPGATPAPATGARSPFDRPWPQARAVHEEIGPPVFAKADFETTLAPWRVEAWKNKGSGRQDATQAHSGSGSVRVGIPPEESAEAITVLVWPSWGGSKVTANLESQRIYELSAWVKLEGRSNPPDLRCSVPAATIRSTRTGRDPAEPSGWQRIWLRLDMEAPATPTYLAAWLQGPGTVWIDDLEMHEIIPPPLQVRLDQSAYDSEDVAGVLTITTARRLPQTPREVLVRLVSEDQTEVGRLSAPFQSTVAVSKTEAPLRMALMAPVSLGTAETRFCPAKLAPGVYAAQVSLLDDQGAALATDQVQFTRLPKTFE